MIALNNGHRCYLGELPTLVLSGARAAKATAASMSLNSKLRARTRKSASAGAYRRSQTQALGAAVLCSGRR